MRAPIACALLMLGCGAQAHRAPHHAPPLGAEPRSEWRALASRLEPFERRPLPLLAGLVDETCPPPADESEDAVMDHYDACTLPRTAAHDDARGLWIVLDVDYSEGGMESFALFEASATSSTPIVEGSADPADTRRLSRSIARLSSLTVAPNLVTGIATTELSLNE